jgi:DNA-binding NarL/FixJ family response regulator
LATARILIVDDDPAILKSLSRALVGHRLVLTVDAREARAALEREPIDLIVVSYRLPKKSGIDLLRLCETSFPLLKRVLIASYDDLPNLVKERVSGLVQRVIQPSAQPKNVRRVIDDILGGQEEAPAEAFDLSQMDALLRWTVRRATQVSGVVIRQLSPSELQLQLVLPTGKGFEQFRDDVVAHWRWPLKARDAPLPPRARKHPVVQLFGDLEVDHELYARRVDDDEEMYVYLALLPWRREARVTAALGVCRKESLEVLQQLLAEVHRFAVDEVAELPLPNVPWGVEVTGPGHNVLEYDWVVTDNYVGADRRQAPTPFLSRFSILGRRRRVPSRVTRTSDSFVDRLAPWARAYALAYLILSAIDTGLTLWCVRHGVVEELNPFLRPLVLHRPWLFLLVKNLLSIVLFFVVARFHLFRIGRALLGATVLAFALLDVYWLWVLL